MMRTKMVPSSSSSSSTQQTLTTHQYQDEDLILNYHDAVIYGSDLRLLEHRTSWLNDSCIHFFFTVLQQQQLQQQQQQRRRSRRSHHDKNSTLSSGSVATAPLLFMDPSVVTFWMHQCTDQDDVEDFVSSTPFPRQRGGKILVPVNDVMSTTSSRWKAPHGGNHWSLLVMTVVDTGDTTPDGTKDTNDGDYSAASTSSNGRPDHPVNNIRPFTVQCWHFDSVRDSGNIRPARDIASKISLHVYNGSDGGNKTDEDVDGKDHTKTTSPSTVEVIEAETPQQINGYDCGVHVLGTAQVFATVATGRNLDDGGDDGGDDEGVDSLATYERKLSESLLGTDPTKFCTTLRHDIVSDILRLKDAEDS